MSAASSKIERVPIPSPRATRHALDGSTRPTVLPGWVLGVALIVLLASIGSWTGVALSATHPSPAVAVPPGVAAPAVAHPLALLPQHRLATVALSPTPHGYLPGPPAWLAYDHADQSFYVAVPPSSVDIVPGNFTWNPIVSETIPVGSNPFGVAYDNLTGDIFVANSGSDNVSVLSGNFSAPIATISVGTSPTGVTFDPVNGDIYVANNGSANVSIISGSTLTLLRNVPVGSNPIGIAADPSTGDVFVANYGSNNVTVISGSTGVRLANVTVDQGPYGVAVDTATDNIYVTDQGSENVSVISGSTFLSVITIPVSTNSTVPLDLQGIAYDPADGMMWVGGGINPLVVISTANESVYAVLTFDPSGVAYNPDTGDVCVTNTANTTFECAQFLGSTPPPTVPLAFQESGLPNGTYWSVTLGGNLLTQSSNFSPIVFSVLPNATAPYQFSVSSGTTYNSSYFPTPESGNVTVGPNGTNVTITFVANPPLYPLVFTESGLPLGTSWTVSIGGSFRTTTGNTLEFSEPNGTYLYVVAGGRAGYSPPPTEGWVLVNGHSTQVQLNFTGPAWYVVTFNDGNDLPSGTNWSVGVNGTWEYAQAPVSTLSFGEPNGTFFFQINGNGTYAATNSSGLFVVAGANLTVPVTFVRIVTYPVTFQETGLPSGWTWSVNLSGQWVGSSSNSIVINEPNGTYWYEAFDSYGLTTYLPTPNNGTVNVAGAPPPVVNLSYAPSGPAYTVAFQETGLPSGAAWQVDLGGWNLSSTTPTISFAAVNGTYQFFVGSVSSYLPSPSLGWVNVSGTATIVRISYATGVLAYGVDVVESGLATGTNWSARLGGTTLYTTGTTLSFGVPNGTYVLNVSAVAGFTANYSPQVVVNGGLVVVAVVFSNSTFPAFFLESGLPSGSLWTVTAVNQATQVVTSGQSTGPQITLRLPDGSYSLTATGPTGYHVSLSTTTLTVHGATPSPVSVSYTGPAPGGTIAATWTVPLVVAVSLITAVLASLAGVWGYTRYRFDQKRKEGEEWVRELQREGRESDRGRTR
jgi:YVTN family beta-propeller protein